MIITNKELSKVTKILDEVIQNYKENSVEKERDWRTYEQQLAERVKAAIHNLEPLIDESINTLTIVKANPQGAEPKLTLKQKTILLLLKHLIGKSNREMSIMLTMFSLLSNVDISYKSVERLYSDNDVYLVLHNMHMLMLQKKGVNGDNCSGDGTGYSLTIKKHYATEAQKLKDKIKTNMKMQFVYSFQLLDIDSRMYIACGMSFKSEKEAFTNALAMAKELGIDIKSLRLDKYYSAQKHVNTITEVFKNVKLYLIPKKNATIRGPWKWKNMLQAFVNNVYEYLKEYFQRNQSESTFSEDKRRTGWKINQRRNDRIHTTTFLTTIWHNLFRLGKT